MHPSNRSCLSRRFLGRLAVAVLALWILVQAPLPAMAESGGPAIPGFFSAAPFDVDGMPDTALVAWWEGDVIRSGLLVIRDGRFVAFPELTPPGGSATNVKVGAAGPGSDRRAIVAWGGAQLDLDIAVFDAAGAVVAPPRTIGKAVQVVPLAITPIDSGALLGYSWDTNPYWDTHVIELDLAGSVLDDERVENTPAPEQTLGVTVPATPEGARAPAWIVSDTRLARIRRYASDGGAEDPLPIPFYDASGPDYRPYAAVFQPPVGEPFAWIAVPSVASGPSVDVAFARTPFGDGPIALGPTLTQLAPRFSSGLQGFAALAGTPEYAVALWEEREWDEECQCSVPPPVRVEFVAQLLRVTGTLEAVGEPFSAYAWLDGDEEEPPLFEPKLVPSGRDRGRFSVLWSNGRLRHVSIAAFGPAVLAVSTTTVGTLMSWQPVPVAVSYNVVRGYVENLIQGDLIHLGPLTCIESDSLDTTTEGHEDPEVPPTGMAFFYLVEAVFDDGTRSLGTGSDGTPRIPGAGGCP